jgi:hypothetical protein
MNWSENRADSVAVDQNQSIGGAMMGKGFRRFLSHTCAALAGLVLVVGVAAAQPTTVAQSTTKGTPTTKTEKLSGTVVQVDGNQLLVKLTSGEVRLFTPPSERRFVVDGKELRLSQLQPGTKLTATITETTTPVTERTVATLEGKVWYAAGTQVILTWPNGENHSYSVKSGDPVKFYDESGKEMTVFDLRKGMNVRAAKITEAPRTEFASDTTVTGTAPTAAAAQAAPGASGASQASSAAPESKAVPTSGGTPTQLPKTASLVPLVGLLGLLFTGVGLCIRLYRRV